MIAAAAQSLAGNEARANAWTNNVRERNPRITRQDFFRAFPMQSASMREKTDDALRALGF